MPPDNDADRNAQIDEIIERIARLEAELARLREYAASLKESKPMPEED